MTVSVETVTIEYVMVEVCPFVGHYEPSLADDYVGLPEEWINAIWVLLEQIDNLQCANCQGGVGLTINDDDDSPQRGSLWNETVLAREGDSKIVALCMDCHPSIDSLDPLPELEAPLA